MLLLLLLALPFGFTGLVKQFSCYKFKHKEQVYLYFVLVAGGFGDYNRRRADYNTSMLPYLTLLYPRYTMLYAAHVSINEVISYISKHLTVASDVYHCYGLYISVTHCTYMYNKTFLVLVITV